MYIAISIAFHAALSVCRQGALQRAVGSGDAAEATGVGGGVSHVGRGGGVSGVPQRTEQQAGSAAAGGDQHVDLGEGRRCVM